MSDYDTAKDRLRTTGPGELMACSDLDYKEVLRAAHDLNLEKLAMPSAMDALSEIRYILQAVVARPVSGTDSSCAFCQAYGDGEPHEQMEFDPEHECVVLTAQRLLHSASPEPLPSQVDVPDQ